MLPKLEDYLTKYHNQFVGKRILLTTNIKSLSEIEIRFFDTDLPHLLGLQKLVRVSGSSTKIIQQIQQQTLQLSHITADPNFSEVAARFEHFDFIRQIFYDEIPAFVNISDMKPKRLGNVNLIFFEFINRNREIVVFGLAPSKQGYYVPATLHVRRGQDSFTQTRKAQVLSLDWLT